jgi:hypothetical protein
MFSVLGIELPDIPYDGTAESVLDALQKLSELYEEVDSPTVGCVIIGKDPQSGTRHVYMVEDERTVTHMYDDGQLKLGVIRHPIEDIEIHRVLRYVGAGAIA